MQCMRGREPVCVTGRDQPETSESGWTLHARKGRVQSVPLLRAWRWGGKLTVAPKGVPIRTRSRAVSCLAPILPGCVSPRTCVASSSKVEASVVHMRNTLAGPAASSSSFRVSSSVYSITCSTARVRHATDLRDAGKPALVATYWCASDCCPHGFWPAPCPPAHEVPAQPRTPSPVFRQLPADTAKPLTGDMPRARHAARGTWRVARGMHLPGVRTSLEAISASRLRPPPPLSLWNLAPAKRVTSRWKRICMCVGAVWHLGVRSSTCAALRLRVGFRRNLSVWH